MQRLMDRLFIQILHHNWLSFSAKISSFYGRFVYVDFFMERICDVVVMDHSASSLWYTKITSFLHTKNPNIKENVTLKFGCLREATQCWSWVIFPHWTASHCCNVIICLCVVPIIVQMWSIDDCISVFFLNGQSVYPLVSVHFIYIYWTSF